MLFTLQLPSLRRSNFLVMAAVLLFQAQAIAQTPQLEVTSTLSGSQTSAEFFGGASIDNGLNYVHCVDPSDSVDIEGSIQVESEHVGRAGNIFVVATLEGELFMFSGTEFLLWDGQFETLLSFANKTLLSSESAAILDDGAFGPAGVTAGELAIYIAYSLSDEPEELYYSATPLRLDIIEGAESSRTEYVGVDSCGTYPLRKTEALVYDTGTIASPASEFDLLLDIYEPDVDLSGQIVPVMVIIHGGGFVGGSRTQSSLQDYGERFAQQGYVAISIDYRVAGQAPVLNQQFDALEAALSISEEEAFVARGMLSALEDSIKALAWLDQYSVSEGFVISNIGLLGGSAGAITSLNLAYALDDFGFEIPEFSVVVNHWGNLLLDTDEELLSISSDEAPVISVHGTADPTVEYAGSAAIHVRADSIGLANEFITSEGAGHGFGQNQLWSSESFVGSGYSKGQRILDFVNAAMLQPECLRQNGIVDLCL